MSPCDIPFWLRIFLIFAPRRLLINMTIAYALLHFQTILNYNSIWLGDANQKFPFHFFFRFAAEGWGEEAREKCKEIFGFARASPRARSRRSPARSERMLQVQATTRSARAKWVRAKVIHSPPRKFSIGMTRGYRVVGRPEYFGYTIERM